MSAFFEVREVRRWFHAGTTAEVRAVDGVSWTIDAGAFGLVTGPSGSGKTTLLALMGTLDRPTDGSIVVGGETLAGLGEGGRSRLRRRLGLAFAAAPLLPRLSLWENVTYGLVPRGASLESRRETAGRWLTAVGLADRQSAAADELSTGERQRGHLARALAGNPEALLVDEPLANLDRASAARVIDVLHAFHEAGGTVVVASHMDTDFDRVTTRLRLREGSVEQE